MKGQVLVQRGKAVKRFQYSLCKVDSGGGACIMGGLNSYSNRNVERTSEPPKVKVCSMLFAGTRRLSL